jgi:hypothetical protein
MFQKIISKMHNSYPHCYKIHQFNYCPLGFLYLLLFVGVFMSYLRYLCFFEYSSVQHILRCVVFLCLNLVYPMFTVSLLYLWKHKTCTFSLYTLLRFLLRNCIGTILQRMHILHQQNRKMLKSNTKIFNVTTVSENNIQ